MSGYVGFLARLQTSASWEVRILAVAQASDMGTVTGRNRRNLTNEFGMNPLECTPVQLRNQFQLQMSEPHPEEEWKLEELRQMLEDRQTLVDRGEEGDELDTLQFYIDTLCEL